MVKSVATQDVVEEILEILTTYDDANVEQLRLMGRTLDQVGAALLKAEPKDRPRIMKAVRELAA